MPGQFSTSLDLSSWKSLYRLLQEKPPCLSWPSTSYTKKPPMLPPLRWGFFTVTSMPVFSSSISFLIFVDSGLLSISGSCAPTARVFIVFVLGNHWFFIVLAVIDLRNRYFPSSLGLSGAVFLFARHQLQNLTLTG